MEQAVQLEVIYDAYLDSLNTTENGYKPNRPAGSIGIFVLRESLPTNDNFRPVDKKLVVSILASRFLV